MHKKTLEQMYVEHRGKVSDKWEIYLAEYERLLCAYRDNPVRLLEIGIQNGGSLEIWAKYFEDARKIIGCDINPDCAALSYEDDRIAVVVGDATSVETKAAILEYSPSFDIVIDDGSHCSSDIVKTFAQYFHYVADGGVYIAEDLHCSYWQEFEGGLFDPFSSIAFFKRLADIVNQEHWGVERNAASVLNGFLSKYAFAIDEEILHHIHSVEFINSICVVRKRAPNLNTLGIRCVVGEVASVAPEPLAVKSSAALALDQTNNHWANAQLTPEEELPVRIKELSDLRTRADQLQSTVATRDARIAELEQNVAALNTAVAEKNTYIQNLEATVQAFQNSTIWRATKPVRIVGNQLKRINRVAKLTPAAIKRGGGLANTLGKASRIYRHEGVSGIKRALFVVQTTQQINPADPQHNFDRNDYAEWVRRYDTLTDEARNIMRQRIEGFACKPLISVVMPTYNPRPEWLVEAIESVRKQVYPHWELCIADDASPNPEIAVILNRYAASDTRIKIVCRTENGHISAASNSALALAKGEWIALLDHDDLLTEHAFFWVADAINKHPAAALFYSDEDKIDETGRRFDPYFKCDWNVDLFYSHNMFSHLGVYSASVLSRIGGFRIGMEGSQDYDLALRSIEHVGSEKVVHIPRILYHWRVHTESTAQSSDAKPYAMLAGECAINEHFQRCSMPAHVELIGYGYRVHYKIPDKQPLVTIIIPTRNGLEVLSKCITSILQKTTYSNYEILIIDNGSDDAATLEYLTSLAQDPRIRVFRDARPFNYSALNNAAVKISQGELIALLNNDVKVITPEWLSEMVSHALRPTVGAVGARLWYPDNTLQHGGVVLGMGAHRIAGHAHHRIRRGTHGYFGRASLVQNFSAITAACLVMRKELYWQVGGLDEENLKVAFNDIDLCLRIRDAGYRLVWTPYAELYHHESVTRGTDDAPERKARFMEEVEYMKKRWRQWLLDDPAYSPNLTLDYSDFSLAWPPRVELL